MSVNLSCKWSPLPSKVKIYSYVFLQLFRMDEQCINVSLCKISKIIFISNIKFPLLCLRPLTSINVWWKKPTMLQVLYFFNKLDSVMWNVVLYKKVRFRLSVYPCEQSLASSSEEWIMIFFFVCVLFKVVGHR